MLNLPPPRRRFGPTRQADAWPTGRLHGTITGVMFGLFLGWLALGAAAAASPRVRPVGLKPGDTIMLVAPARGVDMTQVRRVQVALERQGYRVLVPEAIDRHYGYLAGSDAERAAELMAAFRDPEVAAIFPFTGGYGTTRILDRLDYGEIQRNPKILIGFSDITGLHLALAAKTRLVTFHSPNPDGGWGREAGMDLFAEHWLWRCLTSAPNVSGEGFAYAWPEGQAGMGVVRPGTAAGELIGGNLSLIAALMGTPYEIETAGKVLFMEDVHEAPYRIDRYLSQLKLAGKLKSPAAVILGQFTDADADAEDATWTMQQVFQDYFGDASYPVISNFPAGHVPRNATLPLGVPVEVDTSRGIVRVLQAPVQ